MGEGSEGSGWSGEIEIKASLILAELGLSLAIANQLACLLQ